MAALSGPPGHEKKGSNGTIRHPCLNEKGDLVVLCEDRG